MLRYLPKILIIVVAAPSLAFGVPVSAQNTSAVGVGDRVRLRTGLADTSQGGRSRRAQRA